MKKTNGSRAASAEQSARRRGREKIHDDIEAAWLIERPDLDLKVACTLLRMARANLMHEARVQAISKAIGLVTGDLHVLLALRRCGKPYELRPTDLFRTLLVTSGAMTKRVTRLQEARLISRVSANDDGRSELVRLTAKGLNIADRAISDIARTVRCVTAEGQLTEHEIDVMDRAFRKLLTVKAISFEETLGKKSASRRRVRA
ncbi:MarR family winged helix-turn-helix transcriptional regulator [Bradyrhizobium sp. SYSU BS000235]|uniref:MarR family winged helix-turn-helix transcriptional regulator n=1 Tax=Bradyrhizobium sp. SYSU BS000235 TaxID=3411332 RepID=UPI003C761163